MRNVMPEFTPANSYKPSWVSPMHRFSSWFTGSSMLRFRLPWRAVRQTQFIRSQSSGNAWLITAFLLVMFLLSWHLFTLGPAFDPGGLSAEQLQMMEFNGDIVQTAEGSYVWNPEKEKVKGVPGPLAVLEKARTELAEAFQIKGTNDHGIAYLVLYTVSRFAVGFLAASIIAIMVGVMLGLKPI